MSVTQVRFEIESSVEEDSGKVVAYYVRGHVDPAAFFGAVEYEYAPGVPFGYVRQTHWRNVPRSAGWMEFVEGHGRGAYPVTVLEVGEYQADKSLAQIVAQNVTAHSRRGCDCSPVAPCHIQQMIERQRARLDAAMGRMSMSAPTDDADARMTRQGEGT